MFSAFLVHFFPFIFPSFKLFVFNQKMRRLERYLGVVLNRYFGTLLCSTELYQYIINENKRKKIKQQSTNIDKTLQNNAYYQINMLRLTRLALSCARKSVSSSSSTCSRVTELSISAMTADRSHFRSPVNTYGKTLLCSMNSRAGRKLATMAYNNCIRPHD